MATLATIFNRFTSNKADGTFTAAAANRPAADVYRLRTIPNEDLYFFVKTIDNTRVVREADPVAPQRSWTTIAACGTAAVLLIGLLLPRASTLLNGLSDSSTA